MQQLAAQAFAAGYWEPPIDPVIEQNGLFYDFGCIPTEPSSRFCPITLLDDSYKYVQLAVRPEWVAAPVDAFAVLEGLATVPVLDPYANSQAFFFDIPESRFPGQTAPLLHLREGIERFFITDINNPAAGARAQSEIAAMWDQALTQGDGGTVTAFNHVPGGSNCLFMDGHVEFGRHSSTDPGKFWFFYPMIAQSL